MGLEDGLISITGILIYGGLLKRVFYLDTELCDIYNQNDPDSPNCRLLRFSLGKRQNYIRALRLKADNSSYDGFLNDKLIPLMVRLKMHSAAPRHCRLVYPANCSDISKVMLDFQEFLIKSKQLFNIPAK